MSDPERRERRLEQNRQSQQRYLEDEDRKAAHKAACKRWHEKNPDYKKEYSLKRKFGITLADYNAMLDEQGGVCAVCGQPESLVDPRTKTVRDLAVDHDHEIGNVRGLLCRNCNTAIGLFGDDLDRIRSALEYLERCAGA